MGVKISKRYSSHNYNSFSTKLFLHIPCDIAYRNFEISNLKFLKKIEILLNMGPYGSENFKTLLLLQFWFLFDQTFSECSL